MSISREVDLLIVGAGLHGLLMAKTYREAHPNAAILVVDKAHSVGGTWARERLYPRLKTNNVLGSYEFSDFPMIPERYGADRGCHIPGRVVHDYLCDAADHYNIAPCLQFNTSVESAAPQDDGRWLVGVQTEDKDLRSTALVIADKIVVASGLTSEPNIPLFLGQDDFNGLLIHSKQLRVRAKDLAACKRVVVLGGNKSAWDVCYDAARSGSRVHMVIRPSGGGPSYVWPKSFSFGLWTLSLAAMSSTRLFMGFDPTLMGTAGPLRWWHRFLHQTRLGNKICHFLWNLLDRHIKRLNGYDTHPQLKKLEPWTTPFWMGNSLSIHNYETSWFDLVREGKITVHIADIASLSRDTIRLSNGEHIPADALVCCTGWKSKPTIQFQTAPASSNPNPFLEAEEIAINVQKAEEEILSQRKYLDTLPRRLSNAPTFRGPPENLSSAADHLYRFMVPWQPTSIQSRNIAFIGVHSSIHAVLVAQVQALWITAFFQGRVKHLTREEVDYDALKYDSVLQGLYGALRRPIECGGAGEKHPDLVFDSIPYVDCLLNDLGMKCSRKAGWWKNAFEPHTPRDYGHLVEEWKTVIGARESEIAGIADKSLNVPVSSR